MRVINFQYSEEVDGTPTCVMTGTFPMDHDLIAAHVKFMCRKLHEFHESKKEAA